MYSGQHKNRKGSWLKISIWIVFLIAVFIFWNPSQTASAKGHTPTKMTDYGKKQAFEKANKPLKKENAQRDEAEKTGPKVSQRINKHQETYHPPISIPSTINLIHSFSYSFWVGLILYSLAIVAGFIFGKKFSGTKTADIRRVQDTGLRTDVKDDISKAIQQMQEKQEKIDTLLASIQTSTQERLQKILQKISSVEDSLPKTVALASSETCMSERQISHTSEAKEKTEGPSTGKPQRTLKDLKEAYGRVSVSNKNEIDEFLGSWNCKRFKINTSHFNRTNRVLFIEEETGDFLSVNIDNSIYMLPNFSSPSYSDSRILLEKCYEVESSDKIETGDKYLIVEPATAVRQSNSLILKKKGIIKVVKKPFIEKQEAESLKGKPESKGINIDEITGEYNKAFHNEALRDNFLRSYPGKGLSLDFPNISFPAEGDCHWVFPDFDCIVTNRKIPDNIKKFFDVDALNFVRIDEIEKIEPARMKTPELIIIQPGKIHLRR